VSTISTSRLLLRPFVLDDVRTLFEMSIEDGMRRWIPDQVYRDEQHAEHVARALMAFTDRAPVPATHPYVLGIEHAGALVGHVGLSPARGSVEIGYAIADRAQGMGLATEAVTAMARWGVAELGRAEVLGLVDVENTPSCRVLEKSGFVRVGESVNSLARPILVYRYRG
jgi:[ribosomal protein S5]-alanine N-acetyltransferase